MCTVRDFFLAGKDCETFFILLPVTPCNVSTLLPATQQQAAVRADVEAGGPLTSRLSTKTSHKSSVHSLPSAHTSGSTTDIMASSAAGTGIATASSRVGGMRQVAAEQPPASTEGTTERKEDEAAEGIPVMFLRRPSIRQFRTVWVEPRAAGEHGIKEQVRSDLLLFCLLLHFLTGGIFIPLAHGKPSLAAACCLSIMTSCSRA